jgi:hypothetical protein
MQLLPLFVALMAPIVLGSQDQYDCSTDGLPNIIIDAGQGASGPVVEFFFPLFADCVSTLPQFLSPGGTKGHPPPGPPNNFFS